MKTTPRGQEPRLPKAIRAFMDETDSESERILADVAAKFGDHPMGWPVPPRALPKWWQISKRRDFQDLTAWFGSLSQEDLDAFWGESAKGQSVYEDAGGYMLRCYRALVALPVDEPYTYQQAADDLLDSALRKASEG